MDRSTRASPCFNVSISSATDHRHWPRFLHHSHANLRCASSSLQRHTALARAPYASDGGCAASCGGAKRQEPVDCIGGGSWAVKIELVTAFFVLLCYSFLVHPCQLQAFDTCNDYLLERAKKMAAEKFQDQPQQQPTCEKAPCTDLRSDPTLHQNSYRTTQADAYVKHAHQKQAQSV